MRTETLVRQIVVLLAAVALLLPASAQKGEEGEWVEVTGEAAIVGGNELAAKEHAKDDAMRQAVEMVAGTIVSGISESKDFMSVRDEITSQGAGYVRKAEQKAATCDGKTCKVTLRALVAKGALQEKLSDLGLLAQKRGYPRVLLLVAEKGAETDAAGAWWGGSGGPRSQIAENELIGFLNKVVDLGNAPDCVDKPVESNPPAVTEQWPFRDECWDDLPPAQRFRFIDYTSIASHPVVQKASGQITDVEARAIASLTDAEMVIVGVANARKAGELPHNAKDLPFHVIWADVSLRVIDVGNGNVVTTASAREKLKDLSVATGGNRALRQAVRRAVPELQRGIAEAWQSEAYAAAWIRLEIDGVKSWNDLQTLKAQLQTAVTGIKSVHQRKLEGGSALLEVQSTGTAEQLATELSSRPLGGLTITVTKVVPGVVGMTLGK